MTVSLAFEIVGPSGASERAGPVVFSLTAMGASTATDSVASDRGFVEGVVLTRPAAPRPRVVRLSVAVDLSSSVTPLDQLDVEPVVFVASEDVVSSTTADPTTLAPSGTSRVCTRLTANGAPIDSFSASFSLLGPGTLADTVQLATGGEACTTYTAPASTAEPTATVTATIDVDGVPVSSAAVIDLATRFVRVSPGRASMTVGSSVLLGAEVLGETDQRVTWSSSGGSIDAAGNFTATSSGTYTITATSVADASLRGQAEITASCVFMAPGPPSVDERFSQASVDVIVLSELGAAGVVLADESDVGETSATVMGVSTGYSYDATATASDTTVRGEVSLSTTDPMVGSSQAIAYRVLHLARLSGSGSAVAAVAVDLDCMVEDDGGFTYELEIDPSDSFGGDGVTVSRDIGSGAEMVRERVTLEVPLSLADGDLFFSQRLTVSQNVTCTARVVSRRVSIEGCL